MILTNILLTSLKKYVLFDKIDYGDYMKFKKVLLASDFDGTLKDDNGVITPDVKSAIADFMAQGGLFTVHGQDSSGLSLIQPRIHKCTGAFGQRRYGL